MKKRSIQLKPKLVPARPEDATLIQNMARFYVYDMSRYCGFISDDWDCPKNGLYESYDFKSYLVDPDKKAYLITIEKELAGFVLLNQSGTIPNLDWNMGEFFILAKFQGKGVGADVVNLVWEQHPGIWEVMAMAENVPALSFWRRTISLFTDGHYSEEIKTIDRGGMPLKRYILSFDTRHAPSQNKDPTRYQLEWVEECSQTLEQRMSDELLADERAYGIDVNYKRFSVLMKDATQRVFAVLSAYTAFSEIYVDNLWVEQSRRGKGYGRALLQALENRYKGQGFNNINLVTSTFQAPEFYKKCGFTQEFARVNTHNPKLTKLFFIKYFDEARQMQGVWPRQK